MLPILIYSLNLARSQPQAECAPHSQLTLDGDRATQCVCDPLTDRESNSRAVRRAGTEASELLKEPALILGRDTRTVVYHLDHDRFV